MPKHFGVASRRSGTLAQHLFSQIPSAQIERSVFNRSHSLKTAFNSGYLVPIFADEALPGDTFSMKVHSFLRMTTPIFPVMDNIFFDLFFFAVPMRLLWSHWEQFNGQQANPGDSIAYLIPQFQNVQVIENSLSDYFGLPLTASTGGGASPNIPGSPFVISFSSLWHRAYNFIWNEWFRDENMQNSVVVDQGDGPDTLSNYVLLRRGKRFDYFTGSLPFTQKGAAVTLPLGTSAPLVGTPAVTVGVISGGGAPTFAGTYAGSPAALQTQGAPNVNVGLAGASAGAGALSWGAPNLSLGAQTATLTGSGAYADLSSATAATINAIRQAFQIQRLLERDARGGSRYTEIIRSHFGVISPDQRLQRPEYLGGNSVRINVHPVARTSSLGGPGAVLPADLGGFGVGGSGGHAWMKSFVEHMVIIGLANIRADINYQQGMNRMWSRRTRYDFYWPAFAHLGEQAVLNQEIMAQGTGADSGVWGYQERYAEYRYKPNMITGTMRSTAATPLDSWHLALKFTSLPALNSVFIPDQPPMSRVLAFSGQPEFFGDFFFEYRCARPMPTFSVPGMVDHF